jgi:16S rRNA (guanine(966)-N(2))-methyltransferase RsmD
MDLLSLPLCGIRHMRVIGGTVRGRRLAAFSGSNIRPTSDRVREALFSILYSRTGSLEGLRVLDVFAGSGALGIEALSRGAAAAWFIDSAAQARRTIAENLERCGFTAKARILEADVLKALQGLPGEMSFDLIFLDPPYGREWPKRILALIDARGVLAGQGLVCLETGVADKVPPHAGGLSCFEQRRYGSTMLHFFHRDANE